MGIHSLPFIEPESLPPGAAAACSTRAGGVSLPPFDSLNLGDHVGDDPAHVALNRQRFASALGARPVFLQQVHGTGVVRLDAQTPDRIEADACWTDERGVACTVMVADCLPVLFATESGDSVAAVHAGWRGLAGEGGRGVLEALMEDWPMARNAAVRGRLWVWLGPCIGPTAFEVGVEVRAAFVSADPGAAGCFIARPGHGDKYLANLPALARRRLQALGIRQVWGNDGSPPWCTVVQASRFFSHRRDAVRLGGSGRLAAAIWRI